MSADYTSYLQLSWKEWQTVTNMSRYSNHTAWCKSWKEEGVEEGVREGGEAEAPRRIAPWMKRKTTFLVGTANYSRNFRLSLGILEPKRRETEGKFFTFLTGKGEWKAGKSAVSEVKLTTFTLEQKLQWKCKINLINLTNNTRLYKTNREP